MKVDLFKLLDKEKNIYVSLPDSLIKEILNKIFLNFRSLRTYQRIKRNDISYPNLKAMFRRHKTLLLSKIISIAEDVGMNNEVIFANILSFRMRGSRDIKNVSIPRYLDINAGFVKGYSLYVAEGTRGAHGKHKAKNVSLASSEVNIILYFKWWLDVFFNQKDLHFYVYIPKNQEINASLATSLCETFYIHEKNLHIYHNNSITIPKYKLESKKLILFLILNMEKIVKQVVQQSPDLAIAYLKGNVDGEGTIYYNPKIYLRYVRIEMKDKKEIHFLSKLLDLISINHTVRRRYTRDGMWWVYINQKKNLRRFSDLVGFDLRKNSQALLEKVVNSFIQEQFSHGKTDEIFLKKISNICNPSSKDLAISLKDVDYQVNSRLRKLYRKGLVSRKKITSKYNKNKFYIYNLSEAGNSYLKSL